MDSVNSTTFIKRPPCMTDTQEKLLYTKELLSGRIFLGCYQERRYVSVLKDYRDVVYINNEEIDLQQDLDKLQKKWLGVDTIKWVGITGPDSIGFPKAYCFWVKLSNLAFGHYWFQIKHVKLLEAEIFLQLKCIRKSQAPLTAIAPYVNEQEISERKNELAKASTSLYSESNEPVWDFHPKKAVLSFQTTCITTISNIQPYLTWRNFVTVIKMICALVIVLIMGAISLIGHLGEYLLKLIREFTLLINAFTPVVIQLIDFLSKIVGGLYILIAGMFYRNTNRPNVQPYRNNNLYSISYSNVVQKIPSQAPPLDWRERNRILRQELLSTPYRKN